MELPTPTKQPISAEALPHFYDEYSARILLKRLRWPKGLICPRCGSTNVREVKTARVFEALSCRECRYNFTTAADSYFHGSRIPLFQHFQFIAVVALEPGSSASRLARLFDWKPTTVGRQIARLDGLTGGDFVSRSETYQTIDNFASSLLYLEQSAVAIDRAGFEERVCALLNPRGRSLRRRTKLRTPSKNGATPLAPPRISKVQRRLPLASPSSLPYLFNADLAYDLVDALRWENKNRDCPRCRSRFVLPVKRQDLRELFRCVDCHYIFNSIAGTIFQGTKLPINKLLQFLIICNALGDDIRMQDICFVLQCTFRTASLWLARIKKFLSPEQFAILDLKAALQLKDGDLTVKSAEDTFAAFCDMKAIVLSEAHFLEYLKRVCRTSLSV